MIPLLDNLRCKLFPLATLMIIALNCIAFVVELAQLSGHHGEQFFQTYTMIPANVVHAFQSANPALMGMAILTIFTAMFLHGGLMHIFGNMVFLFVFGRAVEARLGRARFVGFYLAAGIAAALLQILSSPLSTVSTLGASGAIAGVLGAYLLLWPKAEITGLLMPICMPIKARAYWFLLFWIGMQVFSIVTGGDNSASGGVAYFAHVGGFITGVVVALIVRFTMPAMDVCYIKSSCTPCQEAN